MKNLMVKDTLFALKYISASIVRPESMPFLPTIIHLETTTKCNLACKICPRTSTLSQKVSKDDDRWNRNLSINQFQTILEQFNELRYIRLHGLGEPLMNPDLSRIISIASSRDINAEFTTNATLLTPDKSEALITANISEITISIDGATKEVYEKIRKNAQFETVIENVRALSEIRKKLNKKKPFIRINMVVTTENINELSDVLKMAKNLGAKEFRASPIVPPHPNLKSLVPDVHLWVKVTKEARALAHQLGIGLVFSGLLIQNSNKQKTRNALYSKCKQPWLAPFIRIDGYVTPCCNTSDPHLLGDANIFSQDIRTIWNNYEFRRFRHSLKYGPLPEVCRKCPMIS